MLHKKQNKSTKNMKMEQTLLKIMVTNNERGR